MGFNKKHLGVNLGFNGGNMCSASVGEALANTVAPVVSGTLEVGETLTCSNGTWTGTAPITYSYQWYRGVTPIGADQNTYVATGSDATFSITCEVTATNAYGSDVATSNAVVIIYNPLAYSPRNLWRVADVTDIGTTTTWIDTNGGVALNLANSTLLTEPVLTTNVINTKSAVVYDGVDDNTFKLTNDYGLTFTSGQMVFTFRTPSSWSTADVLFSSNKNLTFANRVLFFIVNGVMKFTIRDSGSVQDLYLDTTLQLDTDYVLSIESDDTTIYSKLNSFPVTLTSLTGYGNIGAWFERALTGATIIAIGNANANTPSFSKLKVAEVHHYPYVDDAQCLDISNSLMNEYSISPPVTNNIVIDGDSIDFGYGGFSFEPNLKLKIANNYFKITNVAVGGRQIGGTTPNMISTSYPTAEYDSTFTRNICLMGGGTNDVCSMLLEGRSVADIFLDWQTYYNDRIAEGYIVIPRTILPRSAAACNNLANFEADRQSLNTLIRDYCALNGIFLCDIGSDATIGQFGDSDNLTYYNADKTHLIQAGQDILGNVWGDAVLAYLASL